MHLDETPAERVCWLWLLALSPPKPAVGATAAAELLSEATVQLQALRHDALPPNPDPSPNRNPDPDP